MKNIENKHTDYDALAEEVMGFMVQMRPPHPHDHDRRPHDLEQVPRNVDRPHPFPHVDQGNHTQRHIPRDLMDAGRGSMGVLGILSHEGGEATPGKIVELSHLSKGRVSNIVSVLNDKGYVEKKPSTTDSRSVVVALTSKGRDFVAEHERGMREHVAAVLRQLGPEDARDAVRILRRLSEIMTSEVQNIAPDETKEDIEASDKSTKENR